MDRLKEKSYGKLNLMLNISGVREDGYHTLETVMQTVSLHDVIDLRLKNEKGVRIKCNLPFIPTDERNIVWKAVERFQQAAETDFGVEIEINKTIPVGGGMGGGSANAAAVLNMLNSLCGGPLDDERLGQLALTLGADVPFCLKRGAYLAQGVGELLTKTDSMPDCPIVVCKPKVSVSSKAAYGVYDDWQDKEHFDHKKMLAALEAQDLKRVAAAAGNSFEKPISALYPEIGHIKERLLSMGAEASAMTGSGSVVFGIFEGVARAHAAKEALRLSGYRTYVVRPVSQ